MLATDNSQTKNRTRPKTRTMSNPKFQIFKGIDDQFYFRLRAANGEVICSSQGYTTKQSCLNGIEAVKSVAASASIEELD